MLNFTEWMTECYVSSTCDLSCSEKEFYRLAYTDKFAPLESSDWVTWSIYVVKNDPSLKSFDVMLDLFDKYKIYTKNNKPS